MSKVDDTKHPEIRPSDMLSSEQLIKKHGSKSAAIRVLASEGYTTGEIAQKVGVIYQHARNVLKHPLKRTARRREVQ